MLQLSRSLGSLGRCLGPSVGRSLGSLGRCLGPSVGRSLGSLGRCLGPSVGRSLGSLGRCLGPSVGRSLGPAAAAAQPRVTLATGPQQDHTTFYEFRTYCVRPDQNAAFLKLTNEKIHLRTAHSELIGYWTVEYGGLNQVVHIWKYDSYSQRAAVRAALSQDPSWISEYISKAMPMLSSQDNEVTYLVPWSRLQRAPQEGGVYELVSYQMRPGGPAVWGGAFQAACTSHDAPGYGKLLGAFHSEFGPLNRAHAIWWFQSADHRAEIRHKAHTDARVVAAVRDSVVHLDSQKNRLMFPCPFSPMK